MSQTATFAFVGGLIISLPVFAGTVDVVKGQASSTPVPAATMDAVKGQASSRPVSAATVKDVTGQVSINRGKGFKPVVATTQANIGDQVMARPGGHARIVYAEGCAVDVNPGHIVGVAGSCKVAMAKPMTAGLEPVVAAAPTGFPWGTALLGAGLGVAAACVGFCNEEHHHGASHD
jgi:hypothetical protein